MMSSIVIFIVVVTLIGYVVVLNARPTRCGSESLIRVAWHGQPGLPVPALGMLFRSATLAGRSSSHTSAVPSRHPQARRFPSGAKRSDVDPGDRLEIVWVRM